MNFPPSIDGAAAARLALVAAGLALLPLSWLWLRRRSRDPRARLAALAALTLFLTFDLVVFGAYTRLTDSGLGCPDWPGCYGQASPLGAQREIDAAQAVQPSGPVTPAKAWIEMIHRYLAMTVGALIAVLAVGAWRERRSIAVSPWWPTLTLAWVVAQGLFGRYTVTLKLYPAVVTLHLLGGMVLLAMLAVQRAALAPQPLAVPARERRAAAVVVTLLAVQIALGAWVSTHYAVLACSGFPRCNGEWWPAMDPVAGFTLTGGLGEGALTLDALVAIHMAHRVFALVAAAGLSALAWRLLSGRGAARREGRWLALLLFGQLASGLSNVVLGWPLVAALAHTAGAAALLLVLTSLLARSAPARGAPVPAPGAMAPA